MWLVNRKIVGICLNVYCSCRLSSHLLNCFFIAISQILHLCIITKFCLQSILNSIDHLVIACYCLLLSFLSQGFAISIGLTLDDHSCFFYSHSKLISNLHSPMYISKLKRHLLDLTISTLLDSRAICTLQ